MTSVYVRENLHYSPAELSRNFNLSEEKTRSFIRRLISDGVLKTVDKKTKADPDSEEYLAPDAQDEDIGGDKYSYVFTFVGVLCFEDLVIKSYPKYMSKEPGKNDFKQVLDVLRKAKKKRLDVAEYQSDEKTDSNLLALMIWLLDDYADNGLYRNDRIVNEINGSGEILWDKTVNETDAIFSNGRPYYLELYTRKRINDDLDWVRRLHAAVITKITSELEEAELFDIFGICGEYLSEEDLEDFGDIEYIESRIEKELAVQFNTHKQVLLKVLSNFITRKISIDTSSYISIYGTSSFHTVWEDVCSAVFGDQKEQRLSALNLPVGYKNNKDTFLSIIRKPQWSAAEYPGLSYESDTFRPDYVAVKKNRKNQDSLIILDAKYYNIRFNKGKNDVLNFSGNPELESVSKQYMYQLTYLPFMYEQGIKYAANAFLFPSDAETDSNIGSVSLMIIENLAGLQPIQLLKISAKKVFSQYMKNTIEKDIEATGLTITGLDVSKETYNKLLNVNDDTEPVVALEDEFFTASIEEEIEDNLIYLPVIGEIAAGYDSLGEEDFNGYIGINPDKLSPKEPGKYFYLLVKGDSMTGAGILPGDAVLVRRSGKPKNGDFAIVRYEGEEATLKEIRILPDGVKLIPHNPEYDEKYIRGEEFENETAGYCGVVQKYDTLHDARTYIKDKREVDRDKVLWKFS